MSPDVLPCRVCGESAADGTDRICLRCTADLCVPTEAGASLFLADMLGGSAHVPNTVVVEIEHEVSASLFVTVDADTFERGRDRLLVQFAAIRSPVRYRVHDGGMATESDRFPSGPGFATVPTGLPAALTASRHRSGALIVNPVTVDRVDDAHPSHALGREQWARISAGLSRSGLAIECEGRRLRGIRPHPGSGPAGVDLAVACALLADAGRLDPSLFDRALLIAHLNAHGALLPVTDAVAIAVRAGEHGFRRLNVAPADRTRILGTGTGTGVSISGYPDLIALHDSWGS